MCIEVNGNEKFVLINSRLSSLTFLKSCVHSHLMPAIVFRGYFPVGKGFCGSCSVIGKLPSCLLSAKVFTAIPDS